jgi:hypothetical protein
MVAFGPTISPTILSGPTPDLKPGALIQAPLAGMFHIKDPYNMYYAGMRLVGYIAQISALEKTAKKIIDHSDVLTRTQNFFADAGLKSPYKTSDDVYIAGETLPFLILTQGALYFEQKATLKNVRSAIGAEIGKDADKVNLMDFVKSKNPIIRSHVSRLWTKAIARTIADCAFLFGKTSGVSAQVIRITLERSIFAQHFAYDKLTEVVNDVTDRNFYDHPREKLVTAMWNALQQTLSDHNQRGVRRHVMGQFQPLFARIADDVIAGKANSNEVIFMVGEILKHNLSPQDAAHVYNTVSEIGLRQYALRKLDAQSIIRKAQAEEKNKTPWSPLSITSQGPRSPFDRPAGGGYAIEA